MSLASQVSALAQRVATEFKAIKDVPSGVMNRTTTACPFGNGTYINMSANAMWTTVGGTLSGGMQYDNGFIVPVSGVYRVGISTFTTSGGGAAFVCGFGLNTTISPGGDNLFAFQAVPAGLPAMGASSMEEVRLAAGDKLTLWGYAAGNQGITPSPSKGPTISCTFIRP